MCYLAKALLWLNDEHNVLSAASIDILQRKVDCSAPKDLEPMEEFIQMLEEVAVCTF